MGDANMKCWFKEVNYPGGQPGDPGCKTWGGLIEFAATNGSYAGSYPFANLVVGPGDTTPVNELTYNGIGGYCGTGAGRVELTFRVSVSGVDASENIVAGSNTVIPPSPFHPPTQVAVPTTIRYRVPVTVTNAGTGASATKWFVFTVITMC
jgi:hypothetical protein